jgi:hypothetical protein
VRPANRSGNGDDQSFALVIALRSMSQCSITGEEVRANNAGGIARTIGGIKRTILRRTFARTLDANVTLLQIERKPILVELPTIPIPTTAKCLFY